MQMTLPGAPTVYYGDEAGLTGWTDPDNRRTYPWGRENVDLIEFYKKAIKFHKKYDLYDNKICTGEEAAECMNCLKRRIESIGYEIVTDRGDNVRYIKEH